MRKRRICYIIVSSVRDEEDVWWLVSIRIYIFQISTIQHTRVLYATIVPVWTSLCTHSYTTCYRASGGSHLPAASSSSRSEGGGCGRVPDAKTLGTVGSGGGRATAAAAALDDAGFSTRGKFQASLEAVDTSNVGGGFGGRPEARTLGTVGVGLASAAALEIGGSKSPSADAATSKAGGGSGGCPVERTRADMKDVDGARE